MWGSKVESPEPRAHDGHMSQCEGSDVTLTQVQICDIVI